MAIQVTTQVLDSDPTGRRPNEYRVRLQHDADFPTGESDPVTGLPVIKHHGIEQIVTITAADGPTFRQAVRALGSAWKTMMAAQLAGTGSKIVGGVRIGDVIGPY